MTLLPTQQQASDPSDMESSHLVVGKGQLQLREERWPAQDHKASRWQHQPLSPESTYS